MSAFSAASCFLNRNMQGAWQAAATMKRTLDLLARVVWIVFLVGCSRGEPGRELAPGQSSHGVTALANPACRLLDRNEIRAALGAGAAESRTWGAGGLGCEWAVGSGKVVQLVVVKDSQYWEDLAKADGGEALPAIAKQAFVAPWLGSFRAGALTPGGCIYVMTPRREVSVRLLRAAVHRLTTRGIFRKT